LQLLEELLQLLEELLQLLEELLQLLEELLQLLLLTEVVIGGIKLIGRGILLKKDLVAKPNQLIEISGNISGVQSKMYNVILARAHRQLKEDHNRVSFFFDIEDLKKASGISDKNDNRIRGYLKKLLDISVEYTDTKGEWGGFNLISEYKKVEDKVRIDLPSTIREALVGNSYYTTLDLLMMKSLEGKYAITLYELAIKYHKVEIPEYSVEDFRKITYTEKSKSYNNFNLLKTKVVEPAIEEINNKTDIELCYTTKKTGRKITAIKFYVKKKGIDIQELIKGEDTIEAELVEATPKVSAAAILGVEELEAAIQKAKRNIYISKAWNKRADNKVAKILKDEGEEFTKDILKRAYEGCKSEIKTTLVQYFNGIIKNVKEEIKESKKEEKPKQKQGVKPKVGGIEGLKIDLREPENEELKTYKAEILNLAKKQYPGYKSLEIMGVLAVAKTLEEVDEIVLDYNINKTLEGTAG